MTLLRFVKILVLALWLGSIFFFAAVVAPTAFSVLPSRALAGQIVSHSLHNMHWIGLVCGLVFLLASVVLRLLEGGSSPFLKRDLLMVVMLGITLYLQFGLERRMLGIRDSMGVIDVVPHDDARRVEFNRLHVWSTRLEGSVLLIGLVLLGLVSAEKPGRKVDY